MAERAQYTPQRTPADRRGHCLSEWSITALVGGALGLSALLWAMVWAVL